MKSTEADLICVLLVVRETRERWTIGAVIIVIAEIARVEIAVDDQYPVASMGLIYLPI